MNLVDDDFVAENGSSINIDVDLSECEDVFTLIAVGVADIEACECAVA